jgi:putative hemolysin
MIEGVLRLADRPVRVIMTPRSKIVRVDANSDRGTILRMVESHRFSRLLVCDGAVDHPVGVVHTKDLLSDSPDRGEVSLAALMSPPLFVPDARSSASRSVQEGEGAHRRRGDGTALPRAGDPDGRDRKIMGTCRNEEDAEPRIVQRTTAVAGRRTLPTDEVETITGIDMEKT